MNKDLAGRKIRRDRCNLPYVNTRDDGPMYVSECCGATVTIFQDDGAAVCKKCYRNVDDRLTGSPRIDVTPKQPTSKPEKRK